MLPSTCTAAREQGITVCGTASNSQPPAELTWALILGLARHILPETAALRGRGPWQHTVGGDLHGSTLGLIGLGKIGTQVARIGAAFGMDVVAWSENLTAERTDAAGVRLAPSKHALLTEADIVSVHLVLGPRSRGLIGAPELALMKETALLINTSRAGIVDQAALLTALSEHQHQGCRTGRLRGGTAAARLTVPGPAKCAGDSAPGICHRTQLPRLLSGSDRRHRGLSQRAPHPHSLILSTRRRPRSTLHARNRSKEWRQHQGGGGQGKPALGPPALCEFHLFCLCIVSRSLRLLVARSKLLLTW